MKCPICGKEIADENFYTVNTTNLEPFTGVNPMEGLQAWGGLGVPREVLCYEGEFVHFRFLHIEQEHLVKMLVYDPERIRQAHDAALARETACEHEGCTIQGMPCYLLPLDEEPNNYYCSEHAEEHGYCRECGLFAAGTEGFDFLHRGICDGCHEALLAEMALEDAVDDWIDFDLPFVGTVDDD